MSLLDRSIREINLDHRLGHKMAPHMQNGVTAFAHCQRVPCEAQFRVGFNAAGQPDIFENGAVIPCRWRD